MTHNGWLSQLIPSVPAEIWTIIVGTILTVVFAVWYNVKLKKLDPKKAPRGVFLVSMLYVDAFNNMMTQVTGDKLRNTYSYLFTIFNYVLIMSFLSLVGFSPAPVSYMFTFTLALVTFIGIYVVGIGTKGLWRFTKEKYANPIEIFSQIAPLLSLSLRLFGATLSGVMLGQILNLVLASVIDAPWIVMWPLLSSLWSWAWEFVNAFLTFIQAFVFVMLTAMYWLGEHGTSWDKKVRNEQYKSEKRIQQDLKKQKHENKIVARQKGD